MILFRTTTFDSNQSLALAALARASGRPATVLVDERNGPVNGVTVPKVSLTEAACASLGLFTPFDFAWRCGDYGFYLARQQFPEVQSFWMIEFDVRIADPAGFFTLTDAYPDYDMLAAELRPAERTWDWQCAAVSKNATPYRCFFPTVRLSSRAIDILLSKRLEQGRSSLRRLFWPNDESFVATTIAQAGLQIADLNSLGETLYDSCTFSFNHLINGDNFVPQHTGSRLYHPVLHGQDFIRKQRRLAEGSALPR